MEDKFEYFMGRTVEDLKEVKGDMKSMNAKLDDLIAKDNRRTGFIAAVSAIFSAITLFVIEVFKKT